MGIVIDSSSSSSYLQFISVNIALLVSHFVVHYYFNMFNQANCSLISDRNVTTTILIYFTTKSSINIRFIWITPSVPL